MDASGFSGSPIVKLMLKAPYIQLVEPFSFRDPAGLAWDVPVETTSDGASIPRALWTIAGGPLSGNYRDAAIIHDRYCDTMERSWRATHRVFRDAMRARGLSRFEAASKYSAVYLFGPRWNATHRWTGFPRWNYRPLGQKSIDLLTAPEERLAHGLTMLKQEQWEQMIIADVEREIMAAGADAFAIEDYRPPVIFDEAIAKSQAQMLAENARKSNANGELAMDQAERWNGGALTMRDPVLRPNTLTIRELEADEQP
ncbi:MAG: DUF1353 domain-containing protein [Erythrobacter sp.]